MSNILHAVVNFARAAFALLRPGLNSRRLQHIDITRQSTRDCVKWCQFTVRSTTCQHNRFKRLANSGLVLRESANGTTTDSQKLIHK
jgi:hypothetical protein